MINILNKINSWKLKKWQANLIWKILNFFYSTEYQINNWYGTKKQFNISNKDLPLECKGIINKFTGRLFNTRYKARNFEIKQIVKPLN